MLGSLTDPQFDINEWAARQVYIALGQFMACAAVMGVDTCPMEGIDPAKYDEVLGIGDSGLSNGGRLPGGLPCRRTTGTPRRPRYASRPKM